MSPPPNVKDEQLAIQATIKDMVLGNNERDIPEQEGQADPKPSVTEDSQPKGEDEPTTYKEQTEKRFQKILAENKEMKDQLAVQKRESAALKERAEKTEPFEREARIEELVKNKPAGWDKMPPEQQIAYVSDQAAQKAAEASQLTPELVQELEISRAEREITRVTGRTWDPRQMAALLQLREGATDISGPELVHLAQYRHSELFGGAGDEHGALPPSHVVNAPRSEQQADQSKTRQQKDDENFVRSARARDKVGMKRHLISAIKDAVVKQTVPKGRRG